MNTFIFVLAIITNSGELSLHSEQVAACPDKQTFVTQMEAMKEKGEFKDWNATCITVPAVKGQDV